MKNVQKGFTLIELMIVVAIIAILAAIAIPQYQNYITKSQFSESQTIADGMKTAIAEYYTQAGQCPTLGTTPGFPTGVSYAGKYVASAAVAAGTAATNPTCDITINFKNTAGSISTPLQGGKNAVFKGANVGGNFTWACTSNVDVKYLPQACQ
ncbi:type IV pilus assembly protein PilA [Dyella jiangningensis]|uniref:pilin n=1 Tax=Dyella sp. AtDHG13 TaxID=1938897 RepID=UPI000888534F|nr:pilin [Dyella sp. AtDHG13]PXV58209.1 type IV pilus assembly protein PilA [Dyella sp. AtDHG13]SDK11825.1 type IV pilus assembly protein PilA [Dyella jiangningensis]